MLEFPLLGAESLAPTLRGERHTSPSVPVQENTVHEPALEHPLDLSFPKHWLDLIGQGGQMRAYLEKGHPAGPVIKKLREGMTRNAEECLAFHDRQLKFEFAFRRILESMGIDYEEAKRMVVHKRPTHVRTDDGSIEIDILQHFVPEVHQPHLELRGGYAEHNLLTDTLRQEDNFAPPEDPSETYQRVTEQLIGNRQGELLAVEDFLRVQHCKEMHDLVEALEHECPPSDAGADRSLYHHVSILVRAMMQYTERTGEIFDTMGIHDIVLWRTLHGIHSRFIDPLHPDEGELDRAQSALLILHAGHHPSINDMISLMNSLNYGRTINGLAVILGLQERLQILPDALRHPDVHIDFRVIYDLLRRKIARESTLRTSAPVEGYEEGCHLPPEAA